MLCPGSLQAEAPLRDKDSSYAVIGSGAHALAELVSKQMLEGLDVSPRDWVGEWVFVPMSEDLDAPMEFSDDQIITASRTSICDLETSPDGFIEELGYEVEVDHEMASVVEEYLDRVHGYRKHSKFAGLFETERSYDLSRWIPDNKGTADNVALVDTTLHVDDLKYGKGKKVIAENNVQGMMYALGVIDEYDYLYDFDTVEITIHQSRIGNLSSWQVTVDELLYWAENELVPAYELSLQEDAPRAPGKEQCAFCKAKATCPELKAHVEQEVREGFPILDGGINTEEAGDILVPLESAELAVTWAKAVEAYAFEQLEAGRAVTDGTQFYKLVHGKGSRHWTDPAKAEQACRNRKVPVADYKKPAEFRSVAQIEKVFGKKKFAKIFGDLSTKKEGKPTLAPMSDKRPAIGTAEAHGFDDLTK
jgi:hypothetical protein